MDLESIGDFISTPAGAYVTLGVGTLITLGTGYLFGRRSSSQKYELERERIAFEKEKLSLEKARLSGDPVELKKLEYAEAERIRMYDREQEDILRTQKLEDMSRKERLDLESRSQDQVEKDKSRAHNLELLEKILPTLQPIVQTYTEELRSYFASSPETIDAELFDTRQKYRESLVDKMLEQLDKTDNLASEGYDISEDDRDRMDRIVDAKYPVLKSNRQPPVPDEIKRLIELIPRVK